MKRLIRKLTGIALICAMLMSAVPAMAAEQAQWAFYIYMCGSDLESTSAAVTRDLVEILAADYPESVKVVVFTGGATEWNPYDMAQSYEESGVIEEGAYIQPSTEHNQLFLIEGGKMELLKTYDGYMDMGDSATVETFVKDAIAVAPAEHVMLEFWDHGGALTGAIIDEISGGGLTLAEIRDAVAAAARLRGGKLDLVGFDACLMSNLENAVLLAPYAQYLVASEELEPDGGWGYSFLNLFRDWSEDRAITAVDIGQAIVDSYAASITDNGQWESNLVGTLALTDLSRIGAVETAYESFSAALLAQIKSDLARGETASYVNLVRIAETTQSMYDGMSMIDLYDFVYNVGQAFPSLSAQAGRVIAALGAPPGSDAAGYQGKVSPKDYVGWTVGGSPAVLYRGTGYPHNNCVGISVYYPLPDRRIPVEYAEKVYGSLAMDSYRELFAQEYVSASGVPVFDGKVEAKPTEQAFILNFSSADAAKSVKKVEYVTTYTELDGNEMKTFLLGTELIPEGWQDGSYSQVPNEDWYALGEHFITLEPVSFEAKSELTGYDTYTYKIYAAVGDNYGKVPQCLFLLHCI